MTNYPASYDDERSLYTVRDDAVSRLTRGWEVGDTTLEVRDPDLFPNSGGFVTVYSFHDAVSVEERVTTFKYEGVSEGLLTGVKPINNKMIPRAEGCAIVLNIMADHRNALTHATIALQKVIGHRGTEDETTIEYFADLLTRTVKIPRPWFDVKPGRHGFTFTSFRFLDQTYRIQEGQSVTWLWDFGDNTLSNERNPTHRYSAPGKYDVTLTVQNDFGRRSIVVRDAITVLGEAPLPGESSVSPETIVSNETVAKLSFQTDNSQSIENPVEKVEWVFEDGTKSTGSYVRTMFQKAGLYAPRIFQRTRLGNFSVQEGPLINVIDRYSVWSIVQPRYSPTFGVFEFSPSTDLWKTSKTQHNFMRAWEEEAMIQDGHDGIFQSGGLHNFANSFEALHISNTSLMTLGFVEIMADLDVVKEVYERTRGFGWTSSRVNWNQNDSVVNDQVYVFFGRSSISENPTDLATVEHYGMRNRLWETLTPTQAAAGFEDILVEEANRPGGRYGKRWRSTNWKDKIYILGSDEVGVLSAFMSFSPSTGVWKTLGAPAIDTQPIDLPEGDMFALSGGLYVADSQNFLSQYSPDNGVWKSLVGTPLWANYSEGTSSDPRTRYKAMYRSDSQSSSNKEAYVSGHTIDSLARYDEFNRTSKSLPFRPQGRLIAGGRF